MYPSLLSRESASRWYSKKVTMQQKLTELEALEEKFAEKKQLDKEVDARILIRGKPTVSSKSSNMNEQEDEHNMIEEDEEMDDNNIIEPEEEEQDSNNFNVNNDSNNYNMYDPEEPDDDDNLQHSLHRDTGFSFLQSSP